MFVKELTFRSLDSRNLTQVYMLYQELRKRIKLKDQKAEQEKNLVVQTKLIRIKDQRVPRYILSLSSLVSCHAVMLSFSDSSHTFILSFELFESYFNF